MSKLEPCPFCNGPAGVFQDDGDYYAECHLCSNRTSLQDTSAEAYAKWNTRVSPNEVTEEMVERVAYYVEHAETHPPGGARTLVSRALVRQIMEAALTAMGLTDIGG